MNENNNPLSIQESDELATMKMQLKSLQAELDKQTTLREDVFRRLLKKRTNSFKNRELISIFFVALVAFGLPPYLYLGMHMSLAFTLFTGLFFTFGLFWELVIWRRFKIGNMMSLDLITTAKNMQRYRKLNKVWLNQIGTPFIIVWLTWYILELIQTLNLPDDGHLRMIIILVFIGCSLVGALVGGLIGYFSFYKPQMKLAQEMIEQIKDIESFDEEAE